MPKMDATLRKWLDEKNNEFNHDGYSQATLSALMEFANFAAAQQSVQRTAKRSAEAVRRGEMEAVIKREYEA